MDDQQASNQQGHLTDFLRDEYKYLTDCYRDNEEAKEKREEFFYATVTTVIVGLVALWQKGGLSDHEFVRILIAGLGAMFVLGILTLQRIVRLDLIADEYKVTLFDIRRYFQEQQLLLYRPFPRSRSRGRLLGGTRAQAVTLVNSLIIAAVVGLTVFSLTLPVWIIMLCVLVSLTAAWIVQSLWVKYHYEYREPREVE